MLMLCRFRAKWKTHYEHITFREHHFKAIIRQKDAEVHNLQAKCEYERKRYEAEATRSRTLSSQVSTFSHTESELRSQLNIYVEKFKQVCSFAELGVQHVPHVYNTHQV